jgi:hypothetical protein
MDENPELFQKQFVQFKVLQGKVFVGFQNPNEAISNFSAAHDGMVRYFYLTKESSRIQEPTAHCL